MFLEPSAQEKRGGRQPLVFTFRIENAEQMRRQAGVIYLFNSLGVVPAMVLESMLTQATR